MVADAEVRRGVAHEVARVDRDDPVVGQQGVEVAAERPRVDQAVAGEVVVRLGRPARCRRRGDGVRRRCGSPCAARRAGRVAARSAPTSPRTPKVSSRWAPSASAVSSTCTTVAPGRDQRAVPHRPHVQGAAPADDQVGVADQLGRAGGGEAARDPERPRVAGEQSLGHRRLRQQRPGALGRVGDGRTRAASPAPGDEDRPLGTSYGLGQLLHRRSRTSRVQVASRPSGSSGELRLGRPRSPTSRLLRLHGQRQVQQDRTPRGHRGPDGIAGDGGRRRRVVDPERHGPDRPGQRRLVDVEVRPRLGHLGRDDDQRRPALGGLGDARSSRWSARSPGAP